MLTLPKSVRILIATEPAARLVLARTQRTSLWHARGPSLCRMPTVESQLRAQRGLLPVAATSGSLAAAGVDAVP